MCDFYGSNQLSLRFNWESILAALPDLPCLSSYQQLPELLLSNLSWGTISFTCVELSRDIFHTLGHRWNLLLPHHMWHHTAYKPGYIKRLAAYYRSLVHHDVPEAIIMVLVAVCFCVLACIWPVMSGSLIACTLILLHTLVELGIKILRLLRVHWAIKLDTMHQVGPLGEPPSVWRVNRAYHLRHHFGDPNAYFGVNSSVIDKLLKTALSLKGRTIAFATDLGELDDSLRRDLHQAGARVTPQNAPVNFETTCILVIDLSKAENVCPQAEIKQMEQFLATVRTNDDIVTKEIWLIVSDAESALAWTSLNALHQRYLADWVTYRRLNAPCILRKIVVGHSVKASPQQVAQRIISALKRDSRNIVVRSYPWVHAYQPLKEWMVATYFQWKV